MRVSARIGDASLTRQAEAVGDRLRARAVHVAFVGHTNRGKSSVINALLGEDVLPTGILPVTVVPTHIAYGETRSAVVHTADGRTQVIAPMEIGEWIAADRNPANERGADFVEVRLPAPVLRAGLRLIDTPGVGSAIASGERSVADVVAHADAAVFVIGADPPVTADECAVFAAAAQRVSCVFVAMNKLDTIPAGASEEIRRYARSAIETAIGRPIDRLFELGASPRVSAPGASTDRDELAGALLALTGKDRERMWTHTADRETLHLVRRAIRVVQRRAQDTYAPVAACDDRIQDIRRAARRLAHETLTLSQFAARTRRKLETRIERERERHRLSILPELAGALERRSPASGRGRDAPLAAIAHELASREARSWGQRLAETLRPAVHAADAEAAQIAAAVDGALAALVGVLGAEAVVAPPDALVPASPGTAAIERAGESGWPAEAMRPRAKRLLSEWHRRRHRLAQAQADLARWLDAAMSAAADDAFRACMTRIEQLDAACEARAGAAIAEADRIIRDTGTLRDRLDPPAHRELARLAELRRDLEAQLSPEAG